METIRAILGEVQWPFVIMATQSVKMNYTRILEAIVIAVVLALLGYVFLLPKLEARQDTMLVVMEELKTEVEKLRDTVTNNRIQLGDRWTATEQKVYERDHNSRHLSEWKEHRGDHRRVGK
jgi:hypothetical protein